MKTVQILKTITDQEAFRILSAIKGTRLLSFEACVEVRLPKRKWVDAQGKARPTVYKISKVNAAIGFNYESSVNRQLTREGKEAEFEALPSTVGTHIPGTPFIKNENTGNLLLWVKVEKVCDDPRYICDGMPIEKAEFEALMAPPSESSRQGTDKTIICRAYSFKNITNFNLSGTKYIIHHTGKIDLPDIPKE